MAKQDPLPEAWFPPAEIRQLRLRARQRCWLAVLRTQVKNRVQSLLQMHGVRATVSDVFGVQGRAWLAAQRVLTVMPAMHFTRPSKLAALPILSPPLSS